jgi:glycosyltransferase involved in cell wall biosynthesis
MFNLETLLKHKEHEVAIFSMQRPENWDTPYKYSFPSEMKFSFSSNLLETIQRPLGSKEVEKKYIRLLDDFQPEIVHLNNIHSQISPIVAEIAYRRGIKVVWTLHDFKLLCPRYDCLRNGLPCKLCFLDKIHVIKNNCMKKSLFASTLAYLEAKKWSKEKLERYTQVFICPSEFMKSQMLAGGFCEEKLMVLPNFISMWKNDLTNCKREDYYCYVGRISIEKGIISLLQVAQQLPYPLKIAGTGPLFDNLQSRYASDNIEFLGYLNQEEVKTLIEKARFSVIPSEWYENNPLSGIESLCLGTPILGANIGGIPELIEKQLNGLLFESRNRTNLKNRIEEMYQSTFDYSYIAQKAHRAYSSENYYTSLMNIYCGK